MYPTKKLIKDLYRSYMNLSNNQKILEEKNRRVNKRDQEDLIDKTEELEQKYNLDKEVEE